MVVIQCMRMVSPLRPGLGMMILTMEKSMQLPKHYWDKGSFSITIPQFCSPQEVLDLNVAVNKKEFIFQPQAEGGNRSFGYHGHKCCSLFLSNSPTVTKITKRLFNYINNFNEQYWKFNLFADFDRPIEVMGSLFGAQEAGYLVNQYGPGDKIDKHIDYMPEDMSIMVGKLIDQSNIKDDEKLKLLNKIKSNDSVRGRKLVFVLQISNPNHYIGGELKLRSGATKYLCHNAAGSAVIFPSFVQHEVGYVKEGIRRSITSFIFDANGTRFQ